jgi:hypothetical protein
VVGNGGKRGRVKKNEPARVGHSRTRAIKRFQWILPREGRSDGGGWKNSHLTLTKGRAKIWPRIIGILAPKKNARESRRAAE